MSKYASETCNVEKNISRLMDTFPNILICQNMLQKQALLRTNRWKNVLNFQLLFLDYLKNLDVLSERSSVVYEFNY